MKKLLYSVFVPVTPKPQPRPRKGKYGNFYTPASADTWKHAVQIFLTKNKQPSIKDAVYLTVNFFFQKSSGLHSKTIPHTKKPDIDNLIKSTMDAITDMVDLWGDDCQVYGVRMEKYFSPDKNGAQIWIESVEEE